MNTPEVVTDWNALLREALALETKGQYQASILIYEKLLQQFPLHPVLHKNYGHVLYKAGRLSECLTAYDKSLALDDHQPELYVTKGAILNSLNQYSEAIASYNKAIQLKSTYPDAYFYRGNVFKQLGEYNEAITDYEQAIALKPDYLQAHHQLGIVLAVLKRYSAALIHYDRVISLQPDYAPAYYNRANALSALGRYEEAIKYYQRAIGLKPDYREAHHNLGNALKELNLLAEALDSLTQAIALQEDSIFFAEGNRFEVKLMLCAWDDYQQSVHDIMIGIDQEDLLFTPYAALLFTNSPAIEQKCAQIWISKQCVAQSSLPPLSQYPPHKKIRVGYFSADFHDHPMMHLMAEVFEQHNKQDFEWIAFSFNPIGSNPWTQRAIDSFDQFMPVHELSDNEVVKLARSLEIDIAIDRKGFTVQSRPNIFKARCAPIQVSYLAYPGTLGANFIDYLIADNVVIPAKMHEYYTEKIVYLPHSYQANCRLREISSDVVTRSQFGLPEQGFIFCCFTNSNRITPLVFDSWMRILHAVEGSVLWLLASNELTADNLRQEAQRRGINASRLVFSPKIPIDQHLNRIRLPDLFLDTFPYNAHTTASDALRMGLPLVTRMGDSFASRVSASLLHAIGLPELITTTLEDYESLAINLATHSTELAQIKNKLRENFLEFPLFNSQQFTQDLESAYRLMYERYQKGLEQDHILDLIVTV